MRVCMSTLPFMAALGCGNSPPMSQNGNVPHSRLLDVIGKALRAVSCSCALLDSEYIFRSGCDVSVLS